MRVATPSATKLEGQAFCGVFRQKNDAKYIYFIILAIYLFLVAQQIIFSIAEAEQRDLNPFIRHSALSA